MYRLSFKAFKLIRHHVNYFHSSVLSDRSEEFEHTGINWRFDLISSSSSALIEFHVCDRRRSFSNLLVIAKGRLFSVIVQQLLPLANSTFYCFTFSNLSHRIMTDLEISFCHLGVFCVQSASCGAFRILTSPPLPADIIDCWWSHRWGIILAVNSVVRLFHCTASLIVWLEVFQLTIIQLAIHLVDLYPPSWSQRIQFRHFILGSL